MQTISIFQSTLPREERLNCQKIWRFLVQFQSTLPREERLGDLQQGILRRISIHAPTRGATLHIRSGSHLCCYFNPRSHERSDYVSVTKYSHVSISIHAPTRGATDVVSTVLTTITDFNPRSHERSDGSCRRYFNA